MSYNSEYLDRLSVEDVGFVMAKESKEALMELDYPFISCRGTKGGSPVAVSIINAMLMMANG